MRKFVYRRPYDKNICKFVNLDELGLTMSTHVQLDLAKFSRLRILSINPVWDGNKCIDEEKATVAIRQSLPSLKNLTSLYSTTVLVPAGILTTITQLTALAPHRKTDPNAIMALTNLQSLNIPVELREISKICVTVESAIFSAPHCPLKSYQSDLSRR